MFLLICNALLNTFAEHMLDDVVDVLLCFDVRRALSRLRRSFYVTAVRGEKLFLTFRFRNPKNSHFEDQLESHPIENNTQLLNFEVRSRHIFWNNLLKPLSIRGEPRNLDEQFCKILPNQRAQIPSRKREVFVCHDMMGNYLEDRFFSKSKKWDDYKFYHWAGIDYFCYFSHRYITIPPPGWINAAHLHGVKVLGTIITEGESGYKLLHEILQSREYAAKIADALVRVAEHFNFEGYLVNVECNVLPEKLNILIYFLKLLTKMMHKRIPNSMIMWYDSVVAPSGNVSWQNEVNSTNLVFFQSCDAILVNYAWNDTNLRNTEAIVKEQCSNKLSKVFVGFDVFGRSKPGKFETKKVMDEMLKYDFSIGLFAPAWTFESLGESMNIKLPLGHDRVNQLFLQRNDLFWKMLWKEFSTCAYSKLPFYTDFCLGAGKHCFRFGRVQSDKFFSLLKQSLQPSVPLIGNAERHFEDAFNGGSSLKITNYNQVFRLFVTDFEIQGTLVFAYITKVVPQNVAKLECTLYAVDPLTNRRCEITGGNEDSYLQTSRILLSPAGEDDHRTIRRFMERLRKSLKLPFDLWNGWKINYYIVKFDKAIRITDIGVCLRTGYHEIDLVGLLGGLYVHGGPNFDDVDVGMISVDNYFA